MMRWPPGRTVPGGLEPFEGEGRTGAVTQESFEPSTITGRDMEGVTSGADAVAGREPEAHLGR